MNENYFESNIVPSLKKGAFHLIVGRRPMKLKKGVEGNFEKETHFNCRLGVIYDNLASTKEGRENGSLPAENAGLKGFDWSIAPYTLTATKSGKKYLRCYPTHNDNLKTVMKFFKNGVEVTKEEVEPFVLSGECDDSQISAVKNYPIEYIQVIK